MTHRRVSRQVFIPVSFYGEEFSLGWGMQNVERGETSSLQAAGNRWDFLKLWLLKAECVEILSLTAAVKIGLASLSRTEDVRSHQG